MATNNNTAANPSTLLPLELVDKCIGSRMHMTMKNDREVSNICVFILLLRNLTFLFI